MSAAFQPHTRAAHLAAEGDRSWKRVKRLAHAHINRWCDTTPRDCVGVFTTPHPISSPYLKKQQQNSSEIKKSVKPCRCRHRRPPHLDAGGPACRWLQTRVHSGVQGGGGCARHSHSANLQQLLVKDVFVAGWCTLVVSTSMPAIVATNATILTMAAADYGG